VVAVVFGECLSRWAGISLAGADESVSRKIFQPIGGETSGFTTASTAKGMKALSGKGLACGGHPPQGTAVFTAPPQKEKDARERPE
jgi:hypothetical protein